MSADGFLHRYFLNNGDKRLHKWVHYFDIYERHFERFRGKKPVMVEIGVMGGGSLAMWKSYFGAGCKIVGIDIDPACKQHEAEDIEVYIGSQSDHDVIASVLNIYDKIDIVLDDGSHLSNDMIRTFNMLYGSVSTNGVYAIEDTHTNYWSEWGGGLCKKDTFMEFSKAKIDEINACHTRGALSPTDLTANTDSISFYDSIVVFEKRPQGFRQAPITSGMNFPR